MTYRINLDDVDVDGAVREGADAVAGDTRLSFLKKAGIGGAAAMSGEAVHGARTRRVRGHRRVRSSAGEVRQGRRWHSQLRPYARVPRGGILQRRDRGESAAERPGRSFPEGGDQG
jgi:hypothetical protein